MTTIALDLVSFRENFEQFSNTATHTDAVITNTWAIATCYISDTDYGRLNGACRELAIQSMTAHLLDLSDKISSGAATGQIVGASEDGVSVSLEAPKTRNQFQWWLNTTTYGQRLTALLSASMVGGLYFGGAPERQGFRKFGSRF